MPTEALQRNDRREVALIWIKRVLDDQGFFKEVSYTVKSPEQVTAHPSAYIAGAGGPRDPHDIQNIHFDHRMEAVVYVYWREKEAGQLALELEREIIRPLLDAFDRKGQILKNTEGEDIFVSQIETDEGTLAANGMPVAMAVLVITVLSPASDYP